MAVKFYDTNALLILNNQISEDNYFYISSVTLRELEAIKTNRFKPEDIKYNARVVTHWLDQNPDKYKCLVYNESVHEYISKNYSDSLFNNNDEIICACAKYINDMIEPIMFVSNDICCKNIAKNIFKLQVESLYDKKSDYTGFKEITLTDEELEKQTDDESIFDNKYGLLTNEYAIIKDTKGDVFVTLRCEGEKLVPLYAGEIRSRYFDRIKPKDIYQRCAIDALMNNTLTVLSGKAGSGKTLLSLGVAMHLIESYKYDRLVVLFNPTKTRGAADMGYYGGDFRDKAMQSNVGQILITKFGDAFIVDALLQQEKLKLVSMADARGIEIKDNEIVWITEAQNTSTDLIKLSLSRASSEAKVIVEGDYTSQVDSQMFEGMNNGLKRVIDKFQGQELFGYVQLQNVWRSKIAELCELL